MATLYTIRDWSKNFTVAQNRKGGRDHAGKALTWIAMRTKHDGKTFRRLMREKDGMLLYAAWVLIVQVAAKCPVHGVLADEDGPLTPEDIALKTGGDERVFQRALELLSSERFAWITSTLVDQCSHSGRPVAYQSVPTLRNDTIRNDTIRESSYEDLSETQNASADTPAAEDDPVVETFQCDGTPPTYHVRQSLLTEFGKLFPKLDPHEQVRNAKAWVIAAPERRKTAKGMRKFLTGWFQRSSDRATGNRHTGPPGREPQKGIEWPDLEDRDSEGVR